MNAEPANPQTITLSRVGSGFFVSCGNRFADLAQDEALWICAEFLAGRIHRHLKTETELRVEAETLALGPIARVNEDF